MIKRILLIALLVFSSCVKDQTNVPREETPTDTRYKVIFAVGPKIHIIGDNTNLLFKSASFIHNNSLLQNAVPAYFSEVTGNFYIRSIDNKNILYKGNLSTIIETQEKWYSVEKIEIPRDDNEVIERVFVTKNEIIYTINKNTVENEKDIFLRKIVGNQADLIYRFSDILPSYSYDSFLQTNDIAYLHSMDKLIYRGGRYPNGFQVQIDLNTLEHDEFQSTYFSRIFGSTSEFFMMKWETRSLDDTYDILMDEKAVKKGEILIASVFGSSRLDAIYAYDEIDKQYEFLQKTDGISQMGILKTEDFSFDINSAVPSEVSQHSLVSPFYYYEP